MKYWLNLRNKVLVKVLTHGCAFALRVLFERVLPQSHQDTRKLYMCNLKRAWYFVALRDLVSSWQKHLPAAAVGTLSLNTSLARSRARLCPELAYPYFLDLLSLCYSFIKEARRGYSPPGCWE